MYVCLEFHHDWPSPILTISKGVIGSVVSLYDIGCLIGAMSLGYLADPYGRERTLAFASVVFTIGALVQAGSYSIVQIVLLSRIQQPA